VHVFKNVFFNGTLKIPYCKPTSCTHKVGMKPNTDLPHLGQ
jgi:hypothetical protein